MTKSRGAFIVLEGCDRVGKTTQCKKLVENLRSAGQKAMYINFPARDTPCGSLINSYLTNKQDFTDESIHLLFTLNRWEIKKKMENLLYDGTTLIVDRYSYSGVAYSAAKGLNLDWCKSAETGLLKPDIVFLLNLTPEAMARRTGFGDERYEIPEFQKNVYSIYERLRDEKMWKLIDADKTEQNLNKELFDEIIKAMENAKNKDIGTLW